MEIERIELEVWLLKKEYGHCIKHVGIDEAWKRGARYLGDNRRYLRLLPIGDYNLIDVDAYGVPYQQMKIIAGRQYPRRGRRHIHSMCLRRSAVCDAEGVGILPPHGSEDHEALLPQRMAEMECIFAVARIRGGSRLPLRQQALFLLLAWVGELRGRSPIVQARIGTDKEEGDVPCRSSMSLVGKPGNTAIWR